MIVTVAGPAKRAILERAIEEGPSSTLPVGRVLAATEAAIDIYWSEE
jgi:6-phosphogluconolactonase